MIDESTGTAPVTATTPAVTAPVVPDTKAPVTDPKVADPIVLDTKPISKKYKVKIDGKDEEVEEAELLKGYSHGTAANKKMQEAAALRKQSEEFVNLLRTDPWKLLEDPRLGHNARKIAEEYVWKKIQEDQMTPEQKELAEARQKLTSYEEEKKAAAKIKEDQEHATLQAKYASDYSNDIIKTLEVAGLPKTPGTVKRMAYYMSQALARNIKDPKYPVLGAKDVVELVKQDYINESKELFGALDAEMLVKLLGDDVAGKIRAHDLAKLNSTPADKVKTPSNQPPPDPKKKVAKKMTTTEFQEKMAKIKAGSD
jgi:hypothetical protein